jgi:hypothetical protein
MCTLHCRGPISIQTDVQSIFIVLDPISNQATSTFVWGVRIVETVNPRLTFRWPRSSVPPQPDAANESVAELNELRERVQIAESARAEAEARAAIGERVPPLMQAHAMPHQIPLYEVTKQWPYPLHPSTSQDPLACFLFNTSGGIAALKRVVEVQRAEKINSMMAQTTVELQQRNEELAEASTKQLEQIRILQRDLTNVSIRTTNLGAELKSSEEQRADLEEKYLQSEKICNAVVTVATTKENEAIVSNVRPDSFVSSSHSPGIPCLLTESSQQLTSSASC